MQSIFIQNLWSFLDTESTPLTTIVAIIGVLFAILNLRKISQDSHDRSRPYIALEPRVGVQLNGSIDLVVTNYGQSAARALKIDTSNKHDYDNKDYILEALKGFMGEERYLAPNSSLRIMWRRDYVDGDGNEHINGMPEKIDITVTYKGPKRRLPGTTKQYSEVITVDTGFVRVSPAPYQGNKINYSGDEQIKVLKDIDLAIRTLNQHTANHY